MRKGFTLTEIFIVLIIIGVLFTLSVQVIGVLENARLKHDVSAFGKMQQVVHNYELSTGALPPHSGNFIQIQPLINKGYMTLEEITFKSDPSTTLMLASMWINADNLYVVTTLSAASGIVAVTGSITNNMSKNISLQLACKLEMILDDGSYTSGPGRAGGGLTSTPANHFPNCPSTTVVAAYGYLVYKFK